jgi:phosphoribosyl 1,2-cyclic phosphodiesterase
MMNVKFWGVRGSIPTPLSPHQVQGKVREAVRLAIANKPIPFEVESTYGGNTTCVEVNCDDRKFILDMGTGVRELGKVQLAEALQSKVLRATILQSHVHWDHIQGFPFWAPMYLDRNKFDCQFDFFGGKQWDSQLDLVYRGQMDAPYFPVNLRELEVIGAHVNFQTIHDRWEKLYFNSIERGDSSENFFTEDVLDVRILARKLNHPQETFGYRIDHDGKSLAFTTDHEPYGSSDGIHQGLAELVKNVDVWITDCQYSHDEYNGSKGPQKMGWGHSFPEYIGRVASMMGVKRVITTHHDPDSDDYRVTDLSNQVHIVGQVPAKAAYEGLIVAV